MNHPVESNKITLYETQGCLVFPVQQELTREDAQNLQRKLLQQIHSRNIKGVIIDLSGIDVIDSILWDIFSKTYQMINVIGCHSVIRGLNPGVGASIIELDLDIDAISTAVNLEDALNLLTRYEQALTEEKNDTE